VLPGRRQTPRRPASVAPEDLGAGDARQESLEKGV
jgi:hypothetical protein